MVGFVVFFFFCCFFLQNSSGLLVGRCFAGGSLLARTTERVVFDTMEAEMQELRDLVQQLRTDNQRLVEAQTAPVRTESNPVVADIPRSSAQSNGVHDRLVYVPRERKCPVFRGTVGIGIAEWVDEVRASVRARGFTPVDQAYFIYDHLEGEAKNEIKYRSRSEREDPDKILSILQEMYGCPQSYVALQEKFFSRKQLDGESLQEYSHALFSLMNEVLESAPDMIPNSATLLRDQFVEHVLDPALRRALKQVVRAHPSYTLLDIRKEAIRWEREGMAVEGRSRSYSVPSLCATQVSTTPTTSSVGNYSAEIAEIKELLKRQQEQLNQLGEQLSRLQNPPKRPTVHRNQVVCRRCQQPGHFASHCENERVEPQTQSHFRQRIGSHQEPSEN